MNDIRAEIIEFIATVHPTYIPAEANQSEVLEQLYGKDADKLLALLEKKIREAFVKGYDNGFDTVIYRPYEMYGLWVEQLKDSKASKQ